MRLCALKIKHFPLRIISNSPQIGTNCAEVGNVAETKGGRDSKKKVSIEAIPMLYYLA
jgi:hypothetical protein